MSATYEVRNNETLQRFELETDAGTAFIAYSMDGDAVSLDHTEVPDALAGRGIGSALVKGTLELIAARKQKIVPRCSFVAAYLQRHPEYQSLVVS
jgi:predicted GNAT family acetyltransferase